MSVFDSESSGPQIATEDASRERQDLCSDTLEMAQRIALNTIAGLDRQPDMLRLLSRAPLQYGRSRRTDVDFPTDVGSQDSEPEINESVSPSGTLATQWVGRPGTNDDLAAYREFTREYMNEPYTDTRHGSAFGTLDYSEDLISRLPFVYNCNHGPFLGMGVFNTAFSYANSFESIIRNHCGFSLSSNRVLDLVPEEGVASEGYKDTILYMPQLRITGNEMFDYISTRRSAIRELLSRSFISFGKFLAQNNPFLYRLDQVSIVPGRSDLDITVFTATLEGVSLWSDQEGPVIDHHVTITLEPLQVMDMSNAASRCGHVSAFPIVVQRRSHDRSHVDPQRIVPYGSMFNCEGRSLQRHDNFNDLNARSANSAIRTPVRYPLLGNPGIRIESTPTGNPNPFFRRALDIDTESSSSELESRRDTESELWPTATGMSLQQATDARGARYPESLAGSSPATMESAAGHVLSVVREDVAEIHRAQGSGDLIVSPSNIFSPEAPPLVVRKQLRGTSFRLQRQVEPS